ncbi:MAG TPA: malto-oligosyltrehalose trehalohydrolase [Stenotrophomonas sp.]|nr:malto-oligosyltrehalose trehalohydrolase [Stenotrophomonas sp.]
MSAPPAPGAPPPGPLGAWPTTAGRVGFRLWAPAAREVELLLGEQVLPMQAETGGCFFVEAAAADGSRYRYRIDGADAVPDPASRWQPDGVHGPSAVLVPDYAWQQPRWSGRPWAEAVIYEVHLGACGGHVGLRAQLPRLAAMGITAIELMPVSQFAGTRSWGYDGVLPYAPAAAYGHPRELKALVDAAHAHGLMVLLDVVYNHFGPDGNYLQQYAPAFFREDLPTPWGAAIDFRQPAVQQYFIDNALMWLREYRFDGLRLDAVHAIVPNAFLDQLRKAIAAALPLPRHVHLVLENEHNQASLLARGYTAQWNDDFHNALHVLLTGEREGYYGAFADDPTAHLARVLGEGFAFQGEPDGNGRARGEPSGGLSPDHFVVFAQNHDQIGNRALGERLRTLVSPQRLRAALALTALTPMIPLFFMGEPWGARQPFLFFTDFEPPLDEAVREGRRREFARFAAFADAESRARIPDPNAEATFLASRAPIDEADSEEGARWRDWFSALLALRRRWLVPGLTQARALPVRRLGEGALAVGWELAEGNWHLAFNFGPAPVPMPTGAQCLLLAENVDTGRAVLPVDGFVAWREAREVAQ